MKIAVVSDTHIPKKKKLPGPLLEGLEGADLIIHAGDWQDITVYEELSDLAPVIGVHGNTDDEEIVSRFPDSMTLDLLGWKIGVTHGHGNGRTTEQRAISKFQKGSLDCLIFGHSHIPVLKYAGGLLLFNPGSPTDKRRQTMFSYGMIYAGTRLRAEHIFYC